MLLSHSTQHWGCFCITFRNVFFFLSVYLILYVHEVALTSRPTVKVYLQFSSRLLWNWSWIQFEATRRASKQKLARGEAVCRCHIVRRTSNENWWHNYELRCVCVQLWRVVLSLLITPSGLSLSLCQMFVCQLVPAQGVQALVHKGNRYNRLHLGKLLQLFLWALIW